MAHEFESGFFAGRAAWHGLGTLVSEAPTVAEALGLAGLDWTVSLRAVAAAGADGAWIPAPGARAVVRDTDQRVLGVVGTDFRPLQNRKLADWFAPFERAGARMETMGALRGGQRIWGLARLPGGGDVGAGDSILPYLLLAHGHDGTLTIRCGLTPIRVVCANTLGQAVGAGKRSLIRVRHTSGAPVALEEAAEQIARAHSAFSGSLDTFRSMRAKQIDTKAWREYLRRVIPPTVADATDDSPVVDAQSPAPIPDGASILAGILDSTPIVSTKSTKKADKAPRAWEPITEIFEADNAAGRNLWGAVNAVTGWIDHERGSKAESRLDASWFGAGATLREHAIRTAVEMMAV